MSEANTATVEVTKKARKGGRPAKCLCGCGEVLKPKRTFRQGHDARFHGNAKKVARGKMTMTEATKGMPERGVTIFRTEVASHKQGA